MQELFKKLEEMKHEKELVVYQIFNGYRVCEENGEVAVKDDAKNYIDFPMNMSKLDIRQLKITLLNKNKNREVKEIKIEKVCSCGKPHNVIPEYAIEDKNGHWWNCICNSTLFYPKKHLKG